jgi:hypothetical protein
MLMAFVKATITAEHSGEQLKVLFNPEEYSLNRDNNFASQAVPGLSSPLLQFAHGNLRTLEMELLFDTYEAKNDKERDVRDQTQKLIKFMEIDSTLHAPPVLLVSWASLQFRCVLTRASQKFILFLPDGRPVRARVTVSFTEFIEPGREANEVNRQTADFSKVHTVVEGETIPTIASRHYENPQLWRVIALANKIDDPRAITSGMQLRIPSLPFANPETGEVFA